MKTYAAVTGNEAMAEALRQVNPDVCAAYPITPQTDLMQNFSDFIADGRVTTEMILMNKIIAVRMVRVFCFELFHRY